MKCDHCRSSEEPTKVLTSGNGTNIGYHTSRWCMKCLIANFPQYSKRHWDKFKCESS